MRLHALLAAALLLASAPAQAEEPEPVTGATLLGVGYVLLGAGGVGVATAASCSQPSLSGRGTQWAPGCLGVAFGVGGGMLLAGFPLVVVGAMQRDRWTKWEAAHPIAIAPAAGGATVAFGGTF